MTVDLHTGEITTSLTDVEQAKLDAAEQTIESGKQAIGKALASIRDQRLYRESHGTFEAYCQGRWGISRHTAHDHLLALDVGESLGIPNINRGQAHALAPLRDEPERMREVYESAKDATGGKPTAAAIRAARTPAAPEPEVVEAEIVPFVRPEPPRPTPEAQAQHARETAERQQREDHSRDLARTVWLLGEMSQRVDAAEHLASIWQPSQDIYPQPTTADRLRQAADFLHDLAERWSR